MVKALSTSDTHWHQRLLEVTSPRFTDSLRDHWHRISQRYLLLQMLQKCLCFRLCARPWSKLIQTQTELPFGTALTFTTSVARSNGICYRLSYTVSDRAQDCGCKSIRAQNKWPSHPYVMRDLMDSVVNRSLRRLRIEIAYSIGKNGSLGKKTEYLIYCI
jgi:hypothetical protein